MSALPYLSSRLVVPLRWVASSPARICHVRDESVSFCGGATLHYNTILDFRSPHVLIKDPIFDTLDFLPRGGTG